MLPYICPAIDHRESQNMVKTSLTHSAIASCATFCSCHILTSSVIYYWTNARQHGINLRLQKRTEKTGDKYRKKANLLNTFCKENATTQTGSGRI